MPEGPHRHDREQDSQASRWGRGQKRSFEPPNRFGWGFNEAKGTLTFYTPSSLRTYRAQAPACWSKSVSRPQWRGSFGANEFQLGALRSVARRYRAQLDTELFGQRPVKRPGLRAMTLFHDRLDAGLVALAAPLQRDSWQLYSTLWRAPALCDIAAGDLALAMLVVSARQRMGWRYERAQRLARKKRVEVLRACGLPPQRQWLKLLRKLEVADISLATLATLSELARRSPAVIERLRHLPRLTPAVLAVAHPQLVGHVHPALLHELTIGSAPHAHRLLRDARRMADALDEPLGVFRSVRQLHREHDALIDRARPRAEPALVTFGPPPLPPTDHIIGLRDSVALRKEGEVQRNCLSARFWVSDCQRGELYVYKVTAPERASVAVALQADGRWGVYEMKARYNNAVSAKTEAAVHRWLRRGNRAIATGWRPSEESSSEPRAAPTASGFERAA